MFEPARQDIGLRKEFEKFKKLFIEAFDAIFIFNPDGRIMDVNIAGEELTGYTRRELINMNAFDLRPPDERPRVSEILHTLQTTGYIRNVSDTHVRRKDGSLVPVEVNAKVINIDGERLTLSIFRDITERKKIEAKLRERNENLQILNSVALEITSRLDLREILTRVVQNAVEIEGGDAGAIGFYDEKTHGITYPFVCNLPQSLETIISTKGSSLAEHIIEAKEPVVIEDYPSYPGAIKEFVEVGIKSMMLVPLLSKGTAFGVLGVFNFTSKKKFTKRGLWLLEGIGRQAAIAIENSRLFEEARERARRSEATAEITRIITSTLDLSEVLRRVINEISAAIGTETAGIFFYNPTEERVYGKMGYGPAREHIQDIVEDVDNFPLAGESIKKRNVVLITDAKHDPRVPARFVEQFGLRQVLVLPLIVKEKLIGVIALSHTDEEHEFSPEDVAFAESIAGESAIAIENARLYEGERYVADVLQRSFLPETIPEIPGIEVGVFYTSSSDVGRIGGDFYDFFELSDHLIGLVIGDVSGKGIEVAPITTLAKYTVRAFAYMSRHASSVMELSNIVVAREIETGKFITMVYLIYDWETGRLLVSSAGHPYPIHYVARAKRVHLIENVNAALGILPELSYTEAIERISPGDIIVLYTDGLIEARNGPLFYGVERLMDIIAANASLSPQEIIDTIMSDVNEFTGGKLTDDIAINVLKRTLATPD